ncbi:ATP-dependent DNA helicase Rdh54 [Schizosaccharomyces octosporus yFS286]|uniref:ATP-dependent DNA helicase Rdh54 n=1 Tax=Schizosaccharomyces octosporus (strain yFS286) TaxID=483514 RepID=S9Q364_SCHOY|nr:ATP-dependent DNA helicase Rdh54 [Schizosaccharomyces octosporus yFS286]EPX74537.1 ATP-dependent DNA helicase Rdh54 [Schizosaccharomyces octosporus yFS286]
MKRKGTFQSPLIEKDINTVKTNSTQITASSKLKLDNESNEVAKDQVYCTILWRKITMKKHKTWEGDGYMVCEGSNYTIYNADWSKIGSSTIRDFSFDEGDMFRVGGKEITVENMMSKEEFNSGCLSNRQLNDVHLPDTYMSRKKGSFQSPINQTSNLPRRPRVAQQPRHDPNAAGSLVMQRPMSWNDEEHVDVVVDTFLSKQLQPHQREGICFLYNCLTGISNKYGRCAILADEMGLGKTLQTITVIWTLLKQNYQASQNNTIKNVMVVTPVTLLQNWHDEFYKWLGRERIYVCMAKSQADFEEFFRNRNYSVLIIGYEMACCCIRKTTLPGKIDLLVCDEAHRLKSMQSQAWIVLHKLKIERKLLLTGTPMQNDLMEFYSMVNFLIPGLFGSVSSFKNQFEKPIVRSRAMFATQRDQELGSARLSRLLEYTKDFILRRKTSVLAKHLPPRHDITFFISPTACQKRSYKEALKNYKNYSQEEKKGKHLVTLSTLSQICNSSLLVDKLHLEHIGIRDLLKSSGKLEVIKSLLELFSTQKAKAVIVSQFTETLKLLQRLLLELKIPYLTLLGSTPHSERGSLVEKFNKSTFDETSVLLLSSKAGGCGLNLTGGSRLILFEPSWNPAQDLQALSRIYRTGQRHSTGIYVLLSAGMLDERIYIRQNTKQGLSDSFLDSDESQRQNCFASDDLRELFTYDENEVCLINQLLHKSSLMCQEKNSLKSENTDDNFIEHNHDMMSLSEDNTNSAWKKASEYRVPQYELISIANAFSDWNWIFQTSEIYEAGVSCLIPQNEGFINCFMYRIYS